MVPLANPDLPALFSDIDRRHAAVRADTRISEFLTASPAGSARESTTGLESDSDEETGGRDGGNGDVLGQDPGAQLS
jgi:hypothetical protein